MLYACLHTLLQKLQQAQGHKQPPIQLLRLRCLILQEASTPLSSLNVQQVVCTTPAIDFTVTAAAVSANGHQMLLVGSSHAVRPAALTHHESAVCKQWQDSCQHTSGTTCRSVPL